MLLLSVIYITQDEHLKVLRRPRTGTSEACWRWISRKIRCKSVDIRVKVDFGHRNKIYIWIAKPSFRWRKRARRLRIACLTLPLSYQDITLAYNIKHLIERLNNSSQICPIMKITGQINHPQKHLRSEFQIGLLRNILHRPVHPKQGFQD